MLAVAVLFQVLQLAAFFTFAAAGPLHPLKGRHAARVHRLSERAPPGYQLPSLSYDPRIKSPGYVRLTKDLPGILTNGIAISAHSWELGTLTEALLEVYNSHLTPFEYKESFMNNSKVIPREVLRITANTLDKYDWSGAPEDSNEVDLDKYISSDTSPTPLASKALVDGAGSLGDPCALGTAAWILAHFADQVKGDLKSVGSVKSDDAYAWAVGNQLAYLQSGVKSDNGTISQREGHFELWSDQGFMIPPFLAYLGMTTKNDELLAEALDQWSLISSGLLDPSVNLYRHVNNWDARFWATGNGWMLHGLMRVLASIKSAGNTKLDAKVAEAETTAAAVFTSLFNQVEASGRLPNYMLVPEKDRAPKGEDVTLADSAGTAAVVAAYYRFLKLCPELASPLADKAAATFEAVVRKVSTAKWLTDVVDPQGTNGFIVRKGSGLKSPEGQTLLALMWAARHAAGR